MALIARAADGSVRDGLSLLDQAIALSGGRVAEAAVRDMLGVADRGLVFDLLGTVLRGDAAAALAQFDRLYQEGADPLLVLQDLLDLAHFLTRLKLAPEAGAGDPIAEGDRERARPLAEKLTMPALARVWQMLLKGLGEVQEAPSPIQAAEMVLVRLAYVADLPAPAELVRSLQEPAPPAPAAPAATGMRAAAPPYPARGARRRLPRAVATAPSAGGARCGRRSNAPSAAEPEAEAPERAIGPRRSRRWSRCRRALPRSSPCSTSGARRCCARISRRICTSCISSRGGSSFARRRARRATSPTASASCSANGPGRAG